jgi:hypothetical protein
VGAYITGSWTDDDYDAVSASLSSEFDADSGAKSLLQELEVLRSRTRQFLKLWTENSSNCT